MTFSRTAFTTVLLSFAISIFALSSAQTVDESVRLAVQNNPGLASQQQTVEIAKEQIREARAGKRPSVTASGSIGYESIDSNRTFAFGLGDQPVASAVVEAALPIYTGGRVSAGIKQAKAGFDAAEAQFESELQNLHLSVLTAHMNVITARERVVIRANSVDLLLSQNKASEDRFDVGVVTRTDVAASEARLEAANAALAAAQAQLEAVQASYEFLTATPPTRLVTPDNLGELPTSFEDALQMALRQNPLIRALESADLAAEQAVKVAAGVLKPSVDLVGSASIQETLDQNERDTNLSALARASIPLFEPGVSKSQVRQAKLRQQQSRFDLENARRQIRARVATAWYSREAARQSINATEKQVEAAEIAYDGAQEELAVGTKTTLDVLDQEQALLNARLAGIEAQQDYVIATGELLNATGTLDLSN